MLVRLRGPLAAALVLICAGCTTFDTEREDVVTFVFTQPTTECDVFVGNSAIGRVSISKAAIGVPRGGNEPLRLSCAATAFAPLSAEVGVVRTRDQKVDVLGVGVLTPQALGARVAEPITNVTGPSPIPNPLSTEKTGYPPRITVDIAQRAIIPSPGWQARM